MLVYVCVCVFESESEREREKEREREREVDIKHQSWDTFQNLVTFLLVLKPTHFPIGFRT